RHGLAASGGAARPAGEHRRGHRAVTEAATAVGDHRRAAAAGPPPETETPTQGEAVSDMSDAEFAALQQKFAPLITAIKRDTGAVGAVVLPPYVYVITAGGTHATRYWLPESLDLDHVDVRSYELQPVPPNAPPL